VVYVNCVNYVVDYLCRPEANVYNIDFTRFKLRDMDSNAVLFEVAKPDGAGIDFVNVVLVCCAYAMNLTSICLSVTLVDCDHIVQQKVQLCTREDRLGVIACRSQYRS